MSEQAFDNAPFHEIFIEEPQEIKVTIGGKPLASFEPSETAPLFIFFCDFIGDFDEWTDEEKAEEAAETYMQMAVQSFASMQPDAVDNLLAEFGLKREKTAEKTWKERELPHEKTIMID